MGCLRRDLIGIEKAFDLVVGGKREHDDGDAKESGEEWINLLRS